MSSPDEIALALIEHLFRAGEFGLDDTAAIAELLDRQGMVEKGHLVRAIPFVVEGDLYETPTVLRAIEGGKASVAPPD